MSRQQKTGCNNNNSRLLWTLFRSCCAVVWPGLEKVVWHRICEDEAFDLGSGDTLSLAEQTHFSRLKGGIVSIPSRTQLSELHTPTWEGFHVLPLVPSDVSVSPLPLPDETGDHNYKEGMALWKERISSLLWANGGLWSIHSSIKRRVGVEGERKINVDTKKSAIYCCESTWMQDCNSERRNNFVNFIFVVRKRGPEVFTLLFLLLCLTVWSLLLKNLLQLFIAVSSITFNNFEVESIRWLIADFWNINILNC